MSKADELWNQFSGAEGLDGSRRMVKSDFLAALAEYGQAVRDRDAEICHNVAPKYPQVGHQYVCGNNDGRYDCAAAISREPLP